jgi:hypothetical protein
MMNLWHANDATPIYDPDALDWRAATFRQLQRTEDSHPFLVSCRTTREADAPQSGHVFVLILFEIPKTAHKAHYCV